jgi:lysine-ketoglutarate reductase/saccharopine dehydrogenase-like protein (TIGR00300 family)
MHTRYEPPDFAAHPLASAPDAPFAPAPADGVLPEGYFSTTNLPTYVRVEGRWLLPERPRMDAAIVRLDGGRLQVREGRLVRRGDPVALGMAEDGSEGILVHGTGFREEEEEASGEFQFMTSEVSREKPVDYEDMAAAFVRERDAGGHIVWVLGPAVLHSRGRDAVQWFVHNGFVGALLGGNAIAVHDVEQALMGTTLGMDHRGRPVRGGHAYHMRAINRVRAAGSLAAAVDRGILTEGIMHACVTRGVPYVLCGSIRDDGPLPEVIQDVSEAQAAMREHAVRATMVAMIATSLHSIAFGNMLPSYHTTGAGELRALTTIAVDSSEFLVSKLRDRGTRHAIGVITNAQDFLHVLRDHVRRAQPDAGATAGAA